MNRPPGQARVINNRMPITCEQNDDKIIDDKIMGQKKSIEWGQFGFGLAPAPICTHVWGRAFAGHSAGAGHDGEQHSTKEKDGLWPTILSTSPNARRVAPVCAWAVT